MMLNEAEYFLELYNLLKSLGNIRAKGSAILDRG